LRRSFSPLSAPPADNLCSFVEDEAVFGKARACPLRTTTPLLTGLRQDTKLIYRHFATLYFVVLCDKSESELGILDLIQGASETGVRLLLTLCSPVYVETLDRSFESVCELDLIFNSPKAYAILDEIVMGGAVFETSSLEALRAFNELQRLEKATDSSLTGSSPAASSKFGRR